ncbi:hypothetical protein Lsha_1848 [Legionella shakespearei DSM 23087]|uniref:Uncharacterized protein n=2 Tax=Legionella shakespearei TaxID=45075 RepID=A0A0W0YQH8_9GAMM|nr:hypothetical protein Lsha_1848 [Legionella shakespearei DSM 23087]
MERTMKKQDVIAIDSYVVDYQNNIPQQLSTDLYHFLAKSYHLADQDEFEHLIIRPDIDGELTVLYGVNDEIAGFSRTCRQVLTIGQKQVTTYSAYLYLSPHFKTSATVESVGLTEAIKYKLANPDEEIIYLAFANTPIAYEFIYQLSDTIYPKPNQNIPEKIIQVIEAFKKQNGWISTGPHPMVINSPLVPLRSQSAELIDEKSELNGFYLSANPDFLQGHSLLVYMPLHLANISYGLNHQDSSHCYTQKQPHNSQIRPGGGAAQWRS